MKNHMLLQSDGTNILLYIGKLRLKEAQLESSLSESAWMPLYSGLAIQVGGGMKISATVSALRPLIRCWSGESNFLGTCERAIKAMVISPLTFFWFSRGLRGRTLLWLLGKVDIAVINEKGREVCLIGVRLESNACGRRV